MTPHASTSSDFTPSPEAPSLTYFDESMSAGSPKSDLPSPDFAPSGDFDFQLDFMLEGANLDSCDLFADSSVFQPISESKENFAFDSFAQAVEQFHP